MSPIKIDKKIVKYRVGKPVSAESEKTGGQGGDNVPSIKGKDGRSAKVIRMHEEIQRPEVLIGSTYKIKTPVSDHAMYVTINDIVLNEDTEYEQRRPFEVFINSKNLDHFQWIVALTRIISAVFRKGGDVTFLVDELKAVFDPRGGAWMQGRYVPSLLAAIGDVVERHLGGLIVAEAPANAFEPFVASSRSTTSRPALRTLPAALGPKTCSRSCFGSNTSVTSVQACEPACLASAEGCGPPVAQSSNSTVCTTGIPPPTLSCVIHPTLPVATTSARVRATCVSLRSRNRLASSGCRTLYVPAEPQQRCPSAISFTSNPAAASSARGGCSTFCPCCIEHAE